MTRIALQLTPDLIAAACQLAGADHNADIFDDNTYAIVDILSPTEMHFKLVDEDEIFEAVKTDNDMKVISF